MNFRIVSKLLAIVAMLIGATMVFSLPWAWPALGWRRGLTPPASFESGGFGALLGSLVACFAVGGVLWSFGRPAKGRLYRKEAMAVVGLSWILATVLGALPYYFAGVQRDQGQPMSLADALFESQSGFSTTGATVISDLELPERVPHCILFWRSSTHFLGGLGIIVLFVVLLGQGSAGKAMMRAEMPGPTKEGSTARMQHTAWQFAAMYCVLNAVLSLLLWGMGLTLFDAICHAFGTMATGGFSTYNASAGHFDSALIEYTIIVFMVLAGTNFTLLYLLLLLRPQELLRDVEWRVYMALILGATALVVTAGLFHGSFDNLPEAVRYGLFQVVSIITTTGYGTDDFDVWSHFGRGLLLLLMFVGGCAGSTGGGMKVIRHVLFVKILRIEVERAYRPNVVRPLRLGGNVVEDSSLHSSILVYFSLILTIFIWSWIFVVAWEPDSTWIGVEAADAVPAETADTAAESDTPLAAGGAPAESETPVPADAPDGPHLEDIVDAEPDAEAEDRAEHKLLDSASAVAATLNNIGPGLGIVGATRNYGHFSELSKLLFVVLMMIGRLEIFSIIVLLAPGFWRSR